MEFPKIVATLLIRAADEANQTARTPLHKMDLKVP